MGYFIYSGYYHLFKAYHYLQATIIYAHIPGFSPMINGVTQQLHRWVKAGWEHPGYEQTPNEWSNWGSFGIPCKARAHKCIQTGLGTFAAIPSVLRNSRNEVTNTHGFCQR
uniref:Uncharacterized protein n=1 Tax=Taeniopygia guttata TaxID=59729 RepID=A0A674H202_TAEGU